MSTPFLFKASKSSKHAETIEVQMLLPDCRYKLASTLSQRRPVTFETPYLELFLNVFYRACHGGTHVLVCFSSVCVESYAWEPRGHMPDCGSSPLISILSSQSDHMRPTKRKEVNKKRSRDHRFVHRIHKALIQTKELVVWRVYLDSVRNR